MHSVMIGRQRDDKIVQLIQQGSAFDRYQIEKIIFTNQKCARRIAQKRLARLTETGRIKSSHIDRFKPAVYYASKPKYLEHALLINDIYTALVSQKESYYTIDFRWSYSILNGQMWADALLILYTLPDKKNKKAYFIEVERHPSKKFDKVEKYESIFAQTWWREEWAVIDGEKAMFPKILIVTEEELKIDSKLKFIVATPEGIQKDVYSVLKRVT